jgi:hypothetical protein
MATTSVYYRSHWREGLIRRAGVTGDGVCMLHLKLRGSSRLAGDREFEQGTTWAGDPKSLFSSPGFCSPSR